MQIFSKYGSILRIVTFYKNGKGLSREMMTVITKLWFVGVSSAQFHALIQYPDPLAAANAKAVSLSVSFILLAFAASKSQLLE